MGAETYIECVTTPSQELHETHAFTRPRRAAGAASGPCLGSDGPGSCPRGKRAARIRRPGLPPSRGRLALAELSHRRAGPGGRVLLEAETGTIEGIVLDSLQADAVRGARVLIVGSGQAVFTDAQGRFRIGGLTGGTYAIAFSHPSLQELGFEPEAVTRDVRIGGVTSVRFVMPSRADMLSIACRGEDRPEGTGVLVGWVRDEISGITLPGAVVRVEWTGWRFPSQGTRSWARFSETGDGFETDTDEDGLFRLCAVPEGRVLNISASYGGFEAEVDTLTLPDFPGAEFHVVVMPVEGNGSLTGLVVHEGTGAPVTGVEVVLDGAGRSVTSGDDGRFTLVDVPPGRYSVRIGKSEMVAHLEEVEVAPLARRDLVVRLRPAGGA